MDRLWQTLIQVEDEMEEGQQNHLDRREINFSKFNRKNIIVIGCEEKAGYGFLSGVQSDWGLSGREVEIPNWNCAKA